MNVELFGKVDYNRHGNVASEYPAWYFESKIEDMKEEIGSKKRRLDRGEVPLDNIPYLKAEIEKESVRLREIEESKPILTDKDRSDAWEIYKSLAKGISASMFARDDMTRGLASPHEEAKRLTKPCIGISGKARAIANQCNVKVTNAKVSRNGAAKMFKILGKILDEPTNIEVLRMDKAPTNLHSILKADKAN